MLRRRPRRSRPPRINDQHHPAIIDRIISHVPPATLLVMRACSRRLRARADAILFAHVEVMVTEPGDPRDVVVVPKGTNMRFEWLKFDDADGVETNTILPTDPRRTKTRKRLRAYIVAMLQRTRVLDVPGYMIPELVLILHMGHSAIETDDSSGSSSSTDTVIMGDNPLAVRRPDSEDESSSSSSDGSESSTRTTIMLTFADMCAIKAAITALPRYTLRCYHPCHPRKPPHFALDIVNDRETRPRVVFTLDACTGPGVIVAPQTIIHIHERVDVFRLADALASLVAVNERWLDPPEFQITVVGGTRRSSRSLADRSVLFHAALHHELCETTPESATIVQRVRAHTRFLSKNAYAAEVGAARFALETQQNPYAA
ncbi:hypothetical protein CC85DRAFT_326908 [Cutaneotrichosporon oleaginosum]|uniref:F-box domain-containing protein n=1 Tax=Cutaneotrichosporon oleaginosum TaxID=879819 RepID=A0A0J0XSH3_9TREE|nr:uncharacterized protein CC85DRAFT_326908 [Cutaneotrichosporon oleaginosum]KLT44010.1 hypothetical protein CC85DRAFT_326908 [Cutaneotrichosporon oleaginosum]TXT04043.1 hypothetical protein COLE_07740 [Cutaneotrichosporon oleaginosum]